VRPNHAEKSVDRIAAGEKLPVPQSHKNTV
jgi:hypothetical protein